METRSYNVYKFNELPDEAKAKALENLRDINTDGDYWHNWILEDWTEKLETLGYESAKINYTGFWSQGDGASFSCTVNLEKWLTVKKLKTKYAKELKLSQETGDNIVITNAGHYCHEFMMSIDSDNLSDELESLILEDARDQARSIYSQLKKCYELLQTDQAIIEIIKANDYDFTINGKIS